jgi:hypothetical protein
MAIHPGNSRKSTGWVVARTVLAVIACLFFAASLRAADTVCAQVKIEIAQELTLERQAFDAMMRITNGLDTTPLSNVDITVTFKDEAGNSVRASSDPNDTTASFFIRVDTLSGISNITGNGTVGPKSVAEIHWLIIPAPGSGGTAPKGKLYFIGATLKYNAGGKAESVTVTPDFIYVKPMPLLTLDYFLTQDVFGDDPLTPQVEPVEPYTLGVRVKNTGAAVAKNVKIDSAQPKIIDNNQGLLINFRIIGSFLNDQSASPTLLIPFGDIPGSSASTGRWIMTSSLAGKFIEFSATFSHADELGGAVTSLLQATNTHFLIRDVKVDLPGRDNIRDFLALDGNVVRVYESSGVDTVVSNLSGGSALSATGATQNGDALYLLTTPASAAPMYVQLPDPFAGAKALGRVTRSDGKVIAPENVWLSKKRNADKSLSYFFNIFDAATTGIYNVALTTPAGTPRPPVIQFIPDRTVPEGTQVSFLVEASDPDGTLPTLSVSLTLPSGARFTPQAPSGLTARSIFDWTPATGQAGRYPITFTASDVSLSTTATTVITVTSPIRPGGPDTPVIATPPVATDINVLQPDLSVAISANPLDTATQYQFELYSDAQFSVLVAQNPAINRTPTGASWRVPVNLADNTHYYWRVRASDGTAFSPWATGRFFVNTANDAPNAVAIASPASGTTVASTAPTLTVSNTTDPDGETITYSFEVYTDSNLTQKVAEVANLLAGANGTTSWTVTPVLANATLYHWRAIATDPHGAKSVSAVARFLVDITKPAPGTPTISAPAVGGTVTTANVDLVVGNSSKPQGATLNYFFEIDRSSTFASPSLVRSGARAEGASNTSFTVTGLAENARYFWRAKSSDGLTESEWVYGNFFVDQANDPPSVPTPKNPGDGSWQTTRTPLLEVNPSIDPEGDAIAYHFEIYADAALTQRVGERLTNGLAWLVDPLLTDDTHYYWRARAEDLRGGVSAWSAVSNFLVRTGSSTPTRATLVLTSPAAIVPANGPTSTIAWEITDPEHNASIALYYDSDQQGADGTRIVSELAQDPSSTSGSYAWNHADLPPGTYFIYAIATNRAGSTTVYAPGAFVIPVPEPRGGITVTPTTGLQTTENGGAATFTVKLTVSPRSEVMIGLTSTHADEARVDPPQLVFSAADWSTPKTVTVTGLPDCVNDGDIAYQVITGKAVSTDPDYNGVKGADVSLVNRNSTVGCPSNNAPLANAGPDQTVNSGTLVVLTGSGTDSDGTIASYHWTQIAGPTVTLTGANAASASFTAPTPATPTTFTFQLTVTDNQGATGTDAVDVIVRARPNQPPVANAGADQTVSSNGIVTLAGGGTDPDGTVVSFLWMQIAGSTVTLANANTATASFTAPAVNAPTLFGFQLTVTDNQGASNAATVAITVQPGPVNQPPVASAGANQTVDEGAGVTLAGSGTDVDGVIASYAWTQTAGPSVTISSATSAVASFTAPQVSADTSLTFRLTVTDNAGATGTATTTVTVKDISGSPNVLQNNAPVTGISADAGTDRTYTINVPAGASNLRFQTSGGSGDVDLYVRFGTPPNPDGSLFDCASFGSTNDERCVVTAAAGTWYATIRASSAFVDATFVASYNTGTQSQLQNGVPVSGLTASQGSVYTYTINVPAGASNLRFQTNGGNGDADVYVRYAAPPVIDTGQFDCLAANAASDETCVVTATPGTWYVSVRASSSIEGVSLVASYNTGTQSQLQNGVPVTGLTASAGSVFTYTINVPAGASNLRFQTSGGNGDADVYVRYATPPNIDASQFDCSSANAGSNEVCVLTATPGTWYVSINAVSNIEDVSLVASY